MTTKKSRFPSDWNPCRLRLACLNRMLTHTEERLAEMRERVLALTQKLDNVTQEKEELQARVEEFERRQGLSPDETVRAMESENERLRHELYKKRHDPVSQKDCMRSKSYEMSHKPRGLAVIINNTKFIRLQERVGAEEDTGMLHISHTCMPFAINAFKSYLGIFPFSPHVQDIHIQSTADDWCK
uniref:Caspase family p20 domain-containing protein n=1 Tax=Branchiostoma floridae TaxID=7739 RepID=C3XRE8_BRAFL|eukprot:XP_002613257.1 hypothetical protein BRAFLDRAFT_68222 [Branchiostoma floridae]